MSPRVLKVNQLLKELHFVIETVVMSLLEHSQCVLDLVQVTMLSVTELAPIEQRYQMLLL